MKIKALGIDAAFANMGFAHVEIDQHGEIKCLDLTLTSTEGKSDGKGVRKSSTELRRARELHGAMLKACMGNRIAFVEVPSGSQSASASRSLGIAVGVISGCPIPIIEVSPMEVKIAVTGNRKIKATKDDVIRWAFNRWPDAPWVLHQRKGKTFAVGDLQNCNEHVADALAIIVAGIATPEFKRLAVMAGLPNAVSNPSDQRPPPGSRRNRVVIL